MDSLLTQNLRETFLNKEKFKLVAEFFAEKSVKMHAEKDCDSAFKDYLKLGLQLLISESIDLVFEYTDSPIERIFINSLVLNFIKANPLSLVVMPSVRNAPQQIREFRDYNKNFREFISWYKDKYGDLKNVESYLDSELEKEKMSWEERKCLQRHLVYYVYLSLYDRFHLVLQPGIHDIKVDGRSVRPDMLFWIPSNENIKVLVECDGFKYHSDKVTFIRDRKRDRALKSAGYEVLRYSGSEIYCDPIGTSTDIAQYLWDIKGNNNA